MKFQEHQESLDKKYLKTMIKQGLIVLIFLYW